MMLQSGDGSPNFNDLSISIDQMGFYNGFQFVITNKYPLSNSDGGSFSAFPPFLSSHLIRSLTRSFVAMTGRRTNFAHSSAAIPVPIV